MQITASGYWLWGSMSNLHQGESQLAALFPMLARLTQARRQCPLFWVPLVKQPWELMYSEIPYFHWHHSLEILCVMDSSALSHLQTSTFRTWEREQDNSVFFDFFSVPYSWLCGVYGSSVAGWFLTIPGPTSLPSRPHHLFFSSSLFPPTLPLGDFLLYPFFCGGSATPGLARMLTDSVRARRECDRSGGKSESPLGYPACP